MKEQLEKAKQEIARFEEERKAFIASKSKQFKLVSTNYLSDLRSAIDTTIIDLKKENGLSVSCAHREWICKTIIDKFEAMQKEYVGTFLKVPETPNQ